MITCKIGNQESEDSLPGKCTAVLVKKWNSMGKIEKSETRLGQRVVIWPILQVSGDFNVSGLVVHIAASSFDE